MALIFGSDAGVRSDHTQDFFNKMSTDWSRLIGGISDSFSRLSGDSAGINLAPARENIYVDNGFSNVPGTSFEGSQIENIDDMKLRRVTSQEPKATIYIQKRAFKALQNDYDPTLMDSGEKLLMRATKILFENKCNQISSYESLTKINLLLTDEAELDAARIRAILDVLSDKSDEIKKTVSENASKEFAITGNPSALLKSSEIIEAFDKLLSVSLTNLANNAEKTKTEGVTTWVVDPDNKVDLISIGRGSGTIELTLASNIRTSLSLDGSLGSFSFSVQDPYNLSKITQDEIEIALAAAYRESSAINARGNNANMSDLMRGPQAILRDAQKKERALNMMRKNRINEAFSLFGGAGRTQVLSGGDAAEIVFTINPSSVSGNHISISSTASSEVFNEPGYFKLSMLSLPEDQFLTTEEGNLVDEIYNLLTAYVTEIKRLSDDLANINSNSNIKYARKRMRIFYLGKNLIQPMDTVHIFLRSNTFKDGQQVGPLNALLNGHAFVQAFQNDQAGSDAVLEEEMRQFGLDSLNIPIDLYRSLRTSSFMRNAGTHVFGGLVSTVTENFSVGGGYSLSVSGESNMKWLSISHTNISPGLYQRHGVLEDPLTPFDFSDSIDEATGILKQDPPLLQDNRKRLHMRFNSGANKGKSVTERNIEQDQVTIGDYNIPVIKHAPGMTYRWKEGVITVTLNNNLMTSLGSDISNTSKLRRDMGLHLTTTPFASMDAADIISTVVTGYPHNYETFVINTNRSGTFTSSVNKNSSDSFFHSFLDITRSTNRALGNFQPYKMIKISPDQAASRIALQSDLTSKSDKIQQLRIKLAEIGDQLNNAKFVLSTDGIDNGTNNAANAVFVELNELRNETQNSLDRLVRDIYSSARNAAGENTGLRIYGNDLGFEFDRDIDENEDPRDNFRRIRLRNAVRAVRTQLDVKYNRDNNYFIVSDEYDKDLDIQAFALHMAQKAGPDLFKSSYATPYDLCKSVIEKLNFEFFCDTNGNLQFRPPQYNKTPLSLLLKLFLLDRTEGKKLYPPFMEELFKNKSQKIQLDLEIVNVEILIKNILLGKKDVVDFPNESSVGNIQIDENGTDPMSAKFLLIGSSPPNENITQWATELLNAENLLAAKVGKSSINITSETIKDAEKRINDLNNASIQNVNVSRLTITNDLARLISKREKLLTMSDRFKEHGNDYAKKSVAELSTLGNKSTDRIDINNIIMPFANLIEDDFFDDIGPGSSKRYIITDEQVIDYNFTESDKNVFCRVEVTGEQDLIGDSAGNIGQMPVLAADATDFDLWRMYGYRTKHSVSRPYFKDAETQCAPYALMLLNRARKDTVTGSITIAGNEYYQLGDVVYINSRDMLYYVYGITHEFSYDSEKFVTTLELKYGHSLGDYIPSPLDVIGKNIIKNQSSFNRTIVSRQTSNKQIGVNLGAVVFQSNSSKTEKKDLIREMLSAELGKFNIAQLKDALLKARSQINSNNSSGGSSEFPKVEIRGYVLSDDQIELVTKRMGVVAEWLTNPTGEFIDDSDDQVSLSRYFVDGHKLSSKEIYNIKINSNGDPSLVFDYDPINVVDMSEKNIDLVRMPKEEVYSMSKDEDISNIIEIVLLLEKPRARGDIE